MKSFLKGVKYLHLKAFVWLMFAIAINASAHLRHLPPSLRSVYLFVIISHQLHTVMLRRCPVFLRSVILLSARLFIIIKLRLEAFCHHQSRISIS